MTAHESAPGAANSRGAVTKQSGGGEVSAILPRPSVNLPAADASAYGPCGARTLWTFAVRCPHCGGTHLHRGTGPSVLDGLVRAGCGKRYVVRVRRHYVARGEAA